MVPVTHYKGILLTSKSSAHLVIARIACLVLKDNRSYLISTRTRKGVGYMGKGAGLGEEL